MKKRISVILMTIVAALCLCFGLAACATKVENVHLNFVVDAQTISTIETSGKEAVAIPNNPEKEGYTFDGWYWDNGVWTNPFTANSLLDAPISSDMNVYAHFNTIEYTISYTLDGGTNTNPSTYNIETPTITLSDSIKVGYSFYGWYKESSFNNKVTSIAQGNLGNIELYAKFTINQYTISFNTNGGSEVEAITQDYNTTVSAPSEPTKTGYTFGGWFNGESQVAYDFTTMPAENISLKAKWTPIEYTISYDLVGGTNGDNPVKYTIETETITLADATKVGYTFDGWFSGNDKIESIDRGSIGNVDLQAHWTPIEYTITYTNTKSADNSNPTKYTIESETITLVKLEKLGYTFIDWYNGTEKLTSINKGSIGDITLTADWTVNGYEITYHNIDEATNSNPDVYDVEDEPLMLVDASKAGYTFLGWYTDAEFNNPISVIAVGTIGDKDLYAKWEIIVYTITYINDDTQGELVTGDTLKTDYTVEDNFDFPILASKVTGYEFSGWYTEKVLGTGTKYTGISKGMTGNMTLYSQYAPAVYTITYHNTDGVTNTNATTYTIESEDFTITNLSKVGYTFEGWYSNNELTTTATTTIFKGSHGNLDLYAKWEKITYTLTYNLYGGSYVSGSNPASYTIEDNITLINPTQTGKFFVGWYSLAQNGNLVKQIAAGTTGNITLYARWLTFDSNGGTTISYTPNFSTSGVTKPADPTKDYYDFVGWYFDEQFTKKYEFNNLPTVSSMLYAKWDAVEYTITYILNSGTNSASNPAKYTVEDSVTFVEPSKTGHTFNGWYSDAQYTSALVTQIPIGSHGDITIYANFSINQYTISFNSNGGTSVNDITQNYATSVSSPADPAKNGYSFAGWYNISLTSRYNFTTIPAQNITLYAKWNLITYTIKYNLDGGTNASSNKTQYTIESAAFDFAAPSKTGYIFDGWYADSSYNNAISGIAAGSYGNKEIFAKWQIITYSILYNVPVGTVNDNMTEYTVATPLTELLDAALTGYAFDGWYLDFEYKHQITSVGGGQRGNLTVYGKFTANTYNIWLDGTESAAYVVKFDLNGASGTAPSPQTITSSIALTYPVTPTRTGYVFGGWYDNTECTGSLYDFAEKLTGSLTLYAKWVECENSITVGSAASVTLSGTTETIYTFVPVINGNVSFTTIGSYDTFGRLYGSNNTLLSQDDDSGSGNNFLIVYNVTAGSTYRIAVRGFASSVSGIVTLSLQGNNTVAAGGVALESTRTTATFGESFTISVPAARDGYKFLGWADENAVMYTNGQGVSVKAWDKAVDSVLYSQWERTVYKVSFVLNDGTAAHNYDISLAYGDRLDLNEHKPSRSGFTFGGWYSDISLSTAYEASTMPDHAITLYAKWVTYALGTPKYDTDKKAVSINDFVVVDGETTLPAELFNIVCLDTNGDMAEFTVEVDGTVAVGNTVSVFIDVKAGEKGKTVQIDNVKIYGTPTLSISTPDKGYINLKDGFVGSWFGASGTDTFGNATNIVVRVDGAYSSGDTVAIIIESIDVAGNVVSRTINNVKLYGLPVISYNEDKAEISVNDTVNAVLFNATARDSFGAALDVSVTKTSGTIAAGNTITVKFTVTDAKGNTSTFTKQIKVYGAPTISDAAKLEFTETDDITVAALGLTAKDTYNARLDITLTVKSGVQEGGAVMVYTATVVDVAGNIVTKDYNVKIYGAPSIAYNKVAIKVTEDPTIQLATLSFNLNGGSGSVESQTVTNSVELTYPSIPSRSGYVFAGWYTTSACTTLFDFSANVIADTTVYAKWISYSGGGVLTVNGGGKSVSVVSKSASVANNQYLAFVPLVSGSISVYSIGSLDTYGYLYNSSKTQLTTDDDSGDGNNFKISYNVTAGTLYYVRACGYSASGTTTVYLSGSMPTAGGMFVGSSDGTSILNITATDSFGATLPVSITLKSGNHVAGGYVVYSISATDKFGNTATLDTAAIPVYDQADITLTLGSVSDVIKLSSRGEEFSPISSDSFGNECAITIEAVTGSLTAGQVQDIRVVATDLAGNIRYETISGVKVYGTPIVAYRYEEYYIYPTDNLRRMFTVTDSFAESLLYTVSIIEGAQEAGKTITVMVTAIDDAGNELCDEICILVVDVVYTLKENGYELTSCIMIAENLEVQSEVNGIPVTSIATNAFKNNVNIKKIVIPNSVTTIGDGAFYGCTGLASITIPNSVTRIIEGTFYGCSSLTEITIPFVGDSIKSSSNTYQYPFGYIFGTESYTGGVATKQYYYGSSTSSTTNATYYIPSSLRTVTITGGNILRGAFYECTGLTSITIGNSVTSIGNYAFYNCAGLTTVTIGNSVTSIGNYAFYGCSGLERIIFTGDIAAWGSISGLGNIMCYGKSDKELYIDNVKIEGAFTIPNNVTSIGANAFRGCSGLTTVTIGNNVTSIGESAFSGCSSLTEMTIPFVVGSVKTSSNTYQYPFGYIFGTSSYTGGISTTQDYYGSSTSSTTSTTYYIPSSLKTVNVTGGNILYGAFYNCSGLTSVTITNSMTSIGEIAFSGCSKLTSITIPSSVTSIGYGVFSGCTSMTNVIVESGNIAYHTDSGCLIATASKTLIWGYKNCTIPSNGSVTSIGNRAFSGCTGLTSITIPNSVTSIGNRAFSGCTGLTSITISEGVKYIGYMAFMGCSKLTSVTIPNSVIHIGDNAFYNCSGLTSVIFKNTSGWKVSQLGNTVIDVSNHATAATYLTKTYKNSEWDRG